MEKRNEKEKQKQDQQKYWRGHKKGSLWDLI